MAELSGRLVQFAATFYLARQCSRADFGVFGFLIAIQQVVALLGQAGLVELLTGKIARANHSQGNEQEIEPVHRMASWYRFAWFSLVSSVLLLGTTTDRLAVSPFLLLPAAAGGLFLSKFYLESATHQIMQHRRMAIVLKVVPIALIYTVGVISFSFGKNQLVYFFGGALAALIGLTRVTRSWSMKTVFKEHDGKEINLGSYVMQTLPYAVVAVLGWISGYGNNVIIKFIFGSETVAQYTLAFTLAMPIFMVCNATNQAWNPKFIELSKTWIADDLNHANAAASAIQILMVSFCAVTLILFCPIFLKQLGGNLMNYADVVPEAGFLMLGYVSLHLYYRVSIYYFVNHESKRFMLNSIISGLIGILISVMLMITIGRIGIYYGFIITNVLLGVFFSTYAYTRWSIQWPTGNLTMAVAVIVGAIFLSKKMTSVIGLFIVYCGLVFFMGAVWFGLNRKLLRKVKKLALQPMNI